MGIVKWVLWGVLMAVFLFVLSNCTVLGLNYASLNTEAKPDPSPVIDVTSRQSWNARRDELKSAFETHVYGPWPADTPVSVLSRRVADDAYLEGRATLEEIEIAVGGTSFRLGLAMPKTARETLPIIIGQTFSSNCGVFASMALRQANGEPCQSTDVPGLVTYIFGEHIANPPMAEILDAGYAYASFHASDVVRDDARVAPRDLAAFGSEGGRQPTGTLMAWAYGYTAAIEALSGDDRLDPDRIAIFGHSRHGKSALVAGVWEPRIKAIVSHQSGYGGAALSRSTAGEGLEQMTRGARLIPFVSLPGYPHWFDPAYASYAGRLDDIPVDQHQLLALLAPKPVYLGNARRDVWSDPNSTFRAAQAASDIYGLYDVTGLGADGMREFRPQDEIAYFLRAGGHGTDRRDMDAILAFLDAHLQRQSGGAPLITAAD